VAAAGWRAGAVLLDAQRNGNAAPAAIGPARATMKSSIDHLPEDKQAKLLAMAG
jgi:hypothetical protein